MRSPSFAQAFQQFRLPQEELLAAVKRTFHALGWQFEPVDATCLEARVPLSVWGRGEEFVWVAVDGDGWVRAESECNWRLLLWTEYAPADKNQRNLESFFNRLNQLIILEALGRVPGFRHEEPSWARTSTHLQDLKRRAPSR